MKAELKTPVIVAAAIAVLAAVVFFGWRAISDAGSLDHGQVQYTPGKPPWQETDPNKKGPGGSPGGGGPGAPPPGASAPITPGMPVGPPALGDGKK